MVAQRTLLAHAVCERVRSRQPRRCCYDQTRSVRPSAGVEYGSTDRWKSQNVKQSRVIAAVFAVALAAAGAAASQAQAGASIAVGWGWPGYGPYPPYRYGPYGYGWIGPWGPCGVGACVDDPYLRRAIRRELERLEYRRELEERAQPGIPAAGTLPYGMRPDWPPPTPEAQVQPAYRGSGEIRPEFHGAGQPRQDSVGPAR